MGNENHHSPLAIAYAQALLELANESKTTEAVDDYLATCEKVGKPPERPYSGKVMFRISPEVHARAAIAAQLSGLSMNQWAEKALEEAARR